MDNTEKEEKKEKKVRGQPTVSTVLDDGRIVELVYDPRTRQTAFAVWHGGSFRIEGSVTTKQGEQLTPYSPQNNLIKHDVVLLPSVPEEYGSDEALIAAIKTYLHRYVDVSPRFERIACLYVLLSWVYDAFNEVPYLRLRGDFGSGKTRFLLTVGALCYKPIFASGASTVSPIFYTLDAFRGTLVLDEGDFRFSDEKADIIKILNNGNVRGLPVLRTEISAQREFNPRAFSVYGPKIIAARGSYDDRALESRFITEEMGSLSLRDDIPIGLPSVYKEEARLLRNKLLLYRFRNFGRDWPGGLLDDRTIEPRLRQIFSPLLAVAPEGGPREELRWLARAYHRSMVVDRAMEVEGQVLGVIRDELSSGESPDLTIKNITAIFAARHGQEYERRITTKWIGMVVRKRLGLETRKSHGNFVLSTDRATLARLYQRHGLTDEETSDGQDRVDVGDVGDVPETAAGSAARQ